MTWLGYHIGQESAIASGLRPFLASKALKTAMVALALPAIRRAAKHTSRS